MAVPALALPPLTSDEISRNATDPVGGLFNRGGTSENIGPLRVPLDEDGADTPSRVFGHPRQDSSDSSVDLAASWEEYNVLKVEAPVASTALTDGAAVGESTRLISEQEGVRSKQGSIGEHYQAVLPESIETENPSSQQPRSIPIMLKKIDKKGRYLLTADDPELRGVIQRRLEREAQGPSAETRSRFSDLIFTRQFTAFDRQNPTSAGSPFHGFFTLFWLGTALLLLKVGANNWRANGSVFGRNEIVTMMFHRDVVVLGLTDGFMCASTALCLILQKATIEGHISWNKQGWIIQNVSMIHAIKAPSVMYVPLVGYYQLTRACLRSFGKPSIWA